MESRPSRGKIAGGNLGCSLALIGLSLVLWSCSGTVTEPAAGPAPTAAAGTPQAAPTTSPTPVATPSPTKQPSPSPTATYDAVADWQAWQAATPIPTAPPPTPTFGPPSGAANVSRLGWQSAAALDDTIVVLRSSQTISLSTDRGNNWSTVYLAPLEQAVWGPNCVSAVDDHFVIITMNAQSQLMAHVSQSGRTWTQHQLPEIEPTGFMGMSCSIASLEGRWVLAVAEDPGPEKPGTAWVLSTTDAFATTSVQRFEFADDPYARQSMKTDVRLLGDRLVVEAAVTREVGFSHHSLSLRVDHTNPDQPLQLIGEPVVELDNPGYRTWTLVDGVSWTAEIRDFDGYWGDEGYIREGHVWAGPTGGTMQLVNDVTAVLPLDIMNVNGQPVLRLTGLVGEERITGWAAHDGVTFEPLAKSPLVDIRELPAEVSFTLHHVIDGVPYGVMPAGS